jgi:hypothetical protein
LIAFGNGLDEPDPRVLGYRHLRIVGVEHIAEGLRLGVAPIHDQRMAPQTRLRQHIPAYDWRCGLTPVKT